MDMERTTKLIKRHEGLRLKPYKCPAGYWTWGYGHNLEAKPLSIQQLLVLFDTGPTEELAEQVLMEDIQDALEDVTFFGAMNFFNALSDVRKAVLVDMAFNLGLRNLLMFRRTLAALRIKDYEAAAAEMLRSKWAKQVGQRAKRLSKMMSSNTWPPFLKK